MSRDLDPDLLDEILKNALAPAFMIEGFFDSGTLRFWTGPGTLTWYDYTGPGGGDVGFTGAGNLITLSDMTETQTLDATGVTAALNGLSQALISLCLNEFFRGRRLNIYFAALDDDLEIVGVPYMIWGGFMDQMQHQNAALTGSLAVTGEHELKILNENRVSRLTPEDQKRRYPLDKGLDFTPSLADKQITWGLVS